MRFRRKKDERATEVAASDGLAATAAPQAPPPGEVPGVERLTAVEWARRHQMNAVMAERAAMYAGRRNEPLTEEEFLEMLRRTDV